MVDEAIKLLHKTYDQLTEGRNVTDPLAIYQAMYLAYPARVTLKYEYSDRRLPYERKRHVVKKKWPGSSTDESEVKCFVCVVT